MHSFFLDLRVGWRLLWRANPITWPALLSFVLGIGVNLTILRVAENLFYVPIPDRDRVVLAWSRTQRSGANRVPASWGEFRYWKRESRSFEKLAAYEARSFTLGVQPRRRANGAVVDGEYFTLTGARPALGSAVDPSARPMFGTAVISYRLWQRQWGGDKGVLGSALTLDGTPFTVVGVLSADYEVLPEVDFWIQAEPKAGQKGSLWVLGKLRPGLSIEQARQEMETVASGYADDASDDTELRGAILSPVSMGVFDEDFRFFLIAVACAAVAVLVVASLNISGLLLTAALGRGRELAIRQALGASPWRIVRQLVTESVPLGLLSAAFSWLGAYWAGRIVFGLLPIAGSRQAPENFLVTTGCALALALVAVLIASAAPAANISRLGLAMTLQQGGPAVGLARPRRRLQQVIVVAQLTAAVALLVPSVALWRTVDGFYHLSTGFKVDGTITGTAELPGDSERRIALTRAISSLSGHQYVARPAISTDPLLKGARGQVAFVTDLESRAGCSASISAVAGSYFETLAIPVLEGTASPVQNEMGRKNVVVVNRTFARQCFGTAPAVGRVLRIEKDEASAALQVTGVVGDTRSVHPAFDPVAQIYVPYAVRPLKTVSFFFDGRSANQAVLEQLPREFARFDSDILVFDLESLNQTRSRLFEWHRAPIGILCILTVIAFALAAVGVYGIVAYSAAQRRGEIAVRLALGGQVGRLRWILLREGVTLLCAGMVAGLGIGLFLCAILAKVLVPQLRVADPALLLVPAALIGAVSVLAIYVPTRKVFRDSLMPVLRSD